ncbi:fumarylacetoacetase [Marinobacterium zhoushanense]|uniref:fumarylacetoacetase n=1 Tax=Marinobacterium zhoushanense TaxID=1679163 RepID=A0ABQ1KDB3_9GAMM|nr:fumarylacetoacetase [Marinobacterium zhoushanense]GGB91892.1 fumarylacetoacetase [Marinobacterium zhoushanense]
MRIDQTLNAWLDTANAPGNGFPVQNLPYCSFVTDGTTARIGVGIGDRIVDLHALADRGLLAGLTEATRQAACEPQLNALMALDQASRAELRARLTELLSDPRYSAGVKPCLIAQNRVRFGMPCRVGDYTDFYASIHHATRVGALFRPDNPLLPNYKWVPIGYHGRASSLQVSGGDFRRPVGQLKPPDQERPVVAPCKRLDYELELGIFIAEGNALGEPIALDDSDRHIFGVGLLNDWSARDIQAWEYQPLGPFLSKSFYSSLSPWIVPLEALEPYRTEWTRDAADPQPLAYLESERNRRQGAIDINLEVWIQTQRMRAESMDAQRLTLGNFKDLYWTVGQMVAHHTVNGCNLQPGDLFGSGTLSGPLLESSGSLLELTEGGKHPIQLANGESRTFLEDGDTIILKAYCGDDQLRISLGEVAGTVLPSNSTT